MIAFILLLCTAAGIGIFKCIRPFLPLEDSSIQHGKAYRPTMTGVYKAFDPTRTGRHRVR